MKKILVGLLALVLFFSFSGQVLAAYYPRGRRLIAVNQNIRNTKLQMAARLINVSVTAKSGDTLPATLTVTNNNQTLTINVDGKTVFKRRFWGVSNLSEISVGDKLNISGVFSDPGKTTVQATWVRDLSIQKRFGVFWGNIKTIISDNNFVFTAEKRGDQTVTTDNNTKFVNRKMMSITFADLKVSDQLKIKGEWDSTTKTIFQVTSVKDNSR